MTSGQLIVNGVFGLGFLLLWLGGLGFVIESNNGKRLSLSLFKIGIYILVTADLLMVAVGAASK